MSGANIFKIKVVQPSFYQVRPQTPKRGPNPKKIHRTINLSPERCEIYKLRIERNRGQEPVSAQHKRRQTDTLESYKSATIYQTHHVGKKDIHLDPHSIPDTKLERPRSVLLKKSRKKSWQTYITKIPLFKQEDIIFPKSQTLRQEFEECVAFLKKKSIFVKIVRNCHDSQYEPISNQFVVKIYGKVQVCANMYYLMQNLGKSSVKDIIQAFGPYKESLVRSQIKSLICGIIHCHNGGIIHNRINPETIYMNKQGNLLIDIVKRSEKPPSDLQKQKYFHYFSPELINKQTVSEICDVWAIGCLTLEMLTGNIKASKYHPYNQSYNAIPSFNKTYLRKLRQQCEKFMRKQNEQNNEELSKEIEAGLSKPAQDFISACLKINQKSRPELSVLLDHDFLRCGH